MDPNVGRSMARAVVAVALRPVLWSTACIQLFRLAPRGWWRRAPFLPLPDPTYLRFRMQTMYGDPDHLPEPGDLVTFLEWCRSWPAAARA